MQGVQLELSTAATLAFDVAESPEVRIQRLISENPVVIFTRSSCCMCHVMKNLLSTLGVFPTVIYLDNDEIRALLPPTQDAGASIAASSSSVGPELFIGGTRVGGLESLVALHLSGHLVPKLEEVGAL